MPINNMSKATLSRERYTIGVICALFEEKAAMVMMLDEKHEPLEQKSGDNNSYTLGKIGQHNVVIACLPGGHQGKAAAATVAVHMMHSFPIKFGLMVGIGGGVPSRTLDIRLGDVVVSIPEGAHGGVVQYDLGKLELDGLHRKGHLDKPPKALLSAITSLREKHVWMEPEFPQHLIAILRTTAWPSVSDSRVRSTIDCLNRMPSIRGTKTTAIIACPLYQSFSAPIAKMIRLRSSMALFCQETW